MAAAAHGWWNLIGVINVVCIKTKGAADWGTFSLTSQQAGVFFICRWNVSFRSEKAVILAKQCDISSHYFTSSTSSSSPSWPFSLSLAGRASPSPGATTGCLFKKLKIYSEAFPLCGRRAHAEESEALLVTHKSSRWRRTDGVAPPCVFVSETREETNKSLLQRLKVRCKSFFF